MQHLHCCVSIQYYPKDTVCYQKKGIFFYKIFSYFRCLQSQAVL